MPKALRNCQTAASGLMKESSTAIVFTGLNKARADALYVSRGPLMNANQKRIAGFALKSRLPSVYVRREFVDAGGLMSYGADFADSYRRVATYVDKAQEQTVPKLQ
jgi:putative tryptophan/tyrosine transport system substrate-binding protein